MAGGNPIPERGAASLSQVPIDWRLVDKEIGNNISVTHFDLANGLISNDAAEQSFVLEVVSILSKLLSSVLCS